MFNNIQAKLEIKDTKAILTVDNVVIHSRNVSAYDAELTDGIYDVVIEGSGVLLNDEVIGSFSSVLDTDTRLVLTPEGIKAGNTVIGEVEYPTGLFERRKSYPIVMHNDNEFTIVRYANLHQHTEYSLLDGITRIKDLAKKTEWASAITDHGNMHGFFEFYKEMNKLGKKAIIGCEVYLETPGNNPRKVFNATENDNDEIMFNNEKEPKSTLAGEHLILLAENDTGLHNLFRLVTESSNHFYRKPHVTWDMLDKYHEGLIATTSCIAGTAGRSIKEIIKCEGKEGAEEVLEQNKHILEIYFEDMIRIFGKDNFFVELQNHHFPLEDEIMKRLREYAKEYGLKTAVGIDAHYLNKEDAEIHELWLCKQTKAKYDDPKRMRFSGDGYWVHTSDEVVELFSDDLDALDNTLEIAERCNVEIKSEGYHLPVFPLPEGFKSEREYLHHLCNEGFKKHLGHLKGAERKKYIERVQYEMSVIEKLGLESYFLVVQDFLKYARDDKVKEHINDYFPEPYYNHENIPEHIFKDYEIYVGSSRGSCAGSLLAYCLEISTVDPMKYDLLFERFLNPDRVSMADIDSDFEDSGREQVIEYCRYKYGMSNVSRVVAFGTAAAKNALRSMSSVLGYPTSFTNKLAEFIPKDPGWTLDKALEELPEFKSFCEKDKDAKKVLGYAKKIEGLVLNKTQHTCATLVAPKPITEYMPMLLMDNPQGDEQVWTAQLQGTELEAMGLLKMDFLGLRTLGVAHETIDSIKENYGIELHYENIPLDDMKVYEYLAGGNTEGVFQAESNIFVKAIKGALKDYKSQDAETLFMRVSDCNALVRPGPNQYMAEYAERVLHPEKIHVIHQSMEEELKPTMGIMLYQEQVMRLSQKMAGFSGGQADTLRKAVGKKIPSLMQEYKDYFINGSKEKDIVGCVGNGIDRIVAEKVWNDIEKFAGYGFNKSHAVAYSFHTVRTAWLAYYYPVEYFCAILNSYINTAEKITEYISVCKEKGIEILPPSVNEAKATFSNDGKVIRFGLGGIKYVGSVAETIINERGEGYKSYADFLARIKPNKRVIESLIKSGSLDQFEGTRQAKLSYVEDTVKFIKTIKKRAQKEDFDINEVEFDIPEVDEFNLRDKLALEFETTGFYLSGHPLDEYMQTGITIKNLEAGYKVTVLGVIRNLEFKYSKKTNKSFRTFSIEDKTGSIKAVYFDEDPDELLKEGAVLKFEGKVKVDDFGEQMNVYDFHEAKLNKVNVSKFYNFKKGA